MQRKGHNQQSSFLNMGQPCKAFYINDFQTGIQQRHFFTYDKLCLLSGLISANGREYWVGVTAGLLALQDRDII